MWHNLHRLSEVVSSSLGFDDLHVDLAGCDVVVFREGDVEVSLVVSQVKIDFSSIVEYKDLTMSIRGLVTSFMAMLEVNTLCGRHSSSIGVEVRVYLDRGDVKNYQFTFIEEPVSYTHLTLPTKRIV